MSNDKKLLQPGIGDNQPLVDYCNQLMAAENTALGSVNTLTLQPQFTSRFFPTLPEHQANLVRLCQQITSLDGSTLANTYLTMLQMSSEEIIEYLNSLRNAASTLDEGANANGFSDAKSTFNDIIDSISASFTNFNNGLSPVLELKNKNVLFKDLQDDIHAVATSISATLTNLVNGGAIDNDTILKRVEELKGQLDDINTEIAKGATTKIKDCVMLGLSTGACFAGPELESGMIVGAVVGILGEGGNVSDYMDEQNDLFDQQDQLVVAIRAAVVAAETRNTEGGMLSIASASAQTLQRNLSDELSSASNILSLFKNWSIQLDTLTNKIGSETPPGYFTQQVQAGIEYWTVVQNVCTKNLGMLANSKYG